MIFWSIGARVQKSLLKRLEITFHQDAVIKRLVLVDFHLGRSEKIGIFSLWLVFCMLGYIQCKVMLKLSLSRNFWMSLMKVAFKCLIIFWCWVYFKVLFNLWSIVLIWKSNDSVIGIREGVLMNQVWGEILSLSSFSAIIKYITELERIKSLI